MKKIVILMSAVLLAGGWLAACNPVGSEGWCENMKDTPKSEWSLQETGDYTKYCVLGMDPKAFCEKLEKKDKGDWTANEAADYAANCLTGREE